jgi:hypothetical protein
MPDRCQCSGEDDQGRLIFVICQVVRLEMIHMKRTLTPVRYLFGNERHGFFNIRSYESIKLVSISGHLRPVVSELTNAPIEV